MSLDAHHIYGPKGVGALFVREGVDIVSLLQGRPDEHGKRAGMPNVPGIVGFSVAAELATKELKKESKRESKLRDMFLKYLNENVKFSKTNGSPKRRLPNNINMSFDGIIGQDLVKGLEKHGIVATTSLNDRVLGAIGVKGAKLLGSVRLTMGYDTKERDMRMVMKLVQKIVEGARKKD
jgi:cysteine desulfurase